MGPSKAGRALEALWPTKRPTMLWGPPGIGKSQVVRQAADGLGVGLIDVRASQLDPVDLRGVPSIANGRTVWCVPDFFPSDGEGLFFLDELDKAAPAVQAGLLQLLLDREMGSYRLPDGWWVVAAGNRTEDKAGSNRMISPMMNRLIHLDVECSLEEWKAWAIRSNIRPEVRAFINFRPERIYGFTPSSTEKAFPTPRTWEFVSQILDSVADPDLLPDLIAGTVGLGAQAEFSAFLTQWALLPDVDRLLADPERGSIPSDLCTLHALGGAIVARLHGGKAEVALLKAVAKVLVRMPRDVTTGSLRDAVAMDARMANNKVVNEPALARMLKDLVPLIR